MSDDNATVWEAERHLCLGETVKACTYHDRVISWQLRLGICSSSERGKEGEVAALEVVSSCFMIPSESRRVRGGQLRDYETSR